VRIAGKIALIKSAHCRA